MIPRIVPGRWQTTSATSLTDTLLGSKAWRVWELITLWPSLNITLYVPTWRVRISTLYKVEDNLVNVLGIIIPSGPAQNIICNNF